MGNLRDKSDNQARPEDLGNDPAQVGSDSAGKAGEAEGLSGVEDAAEESVMELDETGQALEADAVAGAGCSRQAREAVANPSGSSSRR